MNTQEEIKAPLRLSRELEYKPGEIATREIVSNNSGSVTLIAFDNGAMFARHQVKADALAYVIHGSVEFEFDDNTRRHLTTGEAILIPADTPHTVLALESSRVMLIRLNA